LSVDFCTPSTTVPLNDAFSGCVVSTMYDGVSASAYALNRERMSCSGVSGLRVFLMSGSQHSCTRHEMLPRPGKGARLALLLKGVAPAAFSRRRSSGAGMAARAAAPPPALPPPAQQQKRAL